MKVFKSVTGNLGHIVMFLNYSEAVVWNKAMRTHFWTYKNKNNYQNYTIDFNGPALFSYSAPYYSLSGWPDSPCDVTRVGYG